MAEGKCPNCGADLKPEILDGLCPKCVVDQAMAAAQQPTPAAFGPAQEVGTPPSGETLPPDATKVVEPPPPAEQPGTRIAHYKLLEKIGEGGMDTVWMAEQTEPIRRMVALKVIKPGVDSAQILARFEAERQDLALTDHPNIARVLDAGSVPQR